MTLFLDTKGSSPKKRWEWKCDGHVFGLGCFFYDFIFRY